MAAASGVSGASLSAGFVPLGLFGFALRCRGQGSSSRLRGARWIGSALSRLLPLWTGLLLVARGLWSIGFGLFTEIKAQLVSWAEIRANSRLTP
ncbi:MAG: hypothetical protein IOD08_03765 [Bradyrhizobium sp.]|jgi:hypothetical protein|uniref:hypothetical protein n=1 Tax=Bradyrhizobium sp. TaxID=376 RepID=UPI0025BE5140|nr:hypothetical protein [Bradyrhizobium sp.]MCA3576382.1 hypothetical protein [Bradyrhizobium sp.]